MHFFWVYYHRGAKFDELRWSIRSVEANYTGPDRPKITVVGDRPPWFHGHNIKVPRVGGPASFKSFRDSLNKLIVAMGSKEIDDEACWMMDDVYFLNKVTADDLRVARHQGIICEKKANRLKGNKWQRLKARTAKMLGTPVYDTATHLPHVIERDKFEFIKRKYDLGPTLWLWELIYCHEFKKNPQPYSPFLARLHRRPDYRQMEEFCRRHSVLNHTSSTWCESLRCALSDRFPTRSPTESEGPVPIKKDFTRGNILISPSIAKTEPPTVRAVLPYRKTEDREPARRWVREYLDGRTASVHFSDHEGETFNRSAAINNAVRLADPAPNDVLCIADADCFITSVRFREAAEAARQTGRLVIPHDSVCRMTPEQSREVLEDKCPHKGPSGRWFRDNRSRQCVSGIIMIRFDSFLLINGFDESFEGWGGEDNAFKIAAETLIGPAVRLDGPLFHLWHKRQEGRNRESEKYRANRRRWLSYRNAAEVMVYEKTSESGFLSTSPYELGSNWELQDLEFDED